MDRTAARTQLIEAGFGFEDSTFMLDAAAAFGSQTSPAAWNNWGARRAVVTSDDNGATFKVDTATREGAQDDEEALA